MIESQYINLRLDGQTGKPQSREVWIDILKAITFLLVPYGHSALPRPFGGSAVDIFHMPMFFLISGYLMQPGTRKGLIKKQAKSLLIPYYLTCIALMLWSVYDAIVWDIDLHHRLSIQIPAALYGAGNKRYCILPEGIEAIGPGWFLWGFFFSYLIVSHVKDHKYGFWICAGCSYLTWKSAQSIYLPLSIQGGMYGSIFMYLGYMGKKCDYLNKIWGGGVIRNKYILIAGAVLYGFCVYYGDMKPVAAKGSILDIICALWVCTLFAIVIRAWSAKGTNWTKMILARFGRRTKFFLCCHCVLFNMVAWGAVADWGAAHGLGAHTITILKLVCEYCLYFGMLAVIEVVLWLQSRKQMAVHP